MEKQEIRDLRESRSKLIHFENQGEDGEGRFSKVTQRESPNIAPLCKEDIDKAEEMISEKYPLNYLRITELFMIFSFIRC